MVALNGKVLAMRCTGRARAGEARNAQAKT
jgi:hypothetical protein